MIEVVDGFLKICVIELFIKFLVIMGGNIFKKVLIRNWIILIEEMFVIKFIKLNGVIGSIWMVVIFMILFFFSFLLIVFIFGLFIFCRLVFFESLLILNNMVEFNSVFIIL